MTPNPPLRVVHVITSLGTGGAERQLESLVNRSGQQTRVISLYEGGPVADALRAAGHQVDVLGMAGLQKATAIPRLALALRRLHPDVVHVHLLAAQLWGIPAARLAGVPVVVSSEHSLMATTIEGRPHTGWLRGLYRGLERLSTHTVAVSATTADRLVAWQIPRTRITVVDNGIDFDGLRFDPAARARVRAELGLAEGDLVIGGVGRLDPVKRMDEVILAAGPLLRAPDAHLVIAGTGDLREALLAQAQQAGIADRVHLLGARADVPGLLSALDVLVSASADETFGMAVVEAVGSGLPVVFVECPALEELPLLPAGAYRSLPGAGPLALALEQAVAAVRRAGSQRLPVPADLVDRYGIDGTVRAIDQLYAALTVGRPRASKIRP